MAAATAACSIASATSASLQINGRPECSSLQLPARHGLTALAPFASSSPLKLISNGSRVSMRAEGIKTTGPMALALLAAAVVPEIAEAASPGISPSLKNLLLSVVAGGVVLVVIGGAVAAVSTFDPVKRK